MRVLKGLAAVLLLGLIALGVAWNQFQQWLDKPLPIAVATPVELTPGSSFSRFARQLGERGLVDQADLLGLHARLSGGAERLHAGEYLLQPGLTPRGLYLLLMRGEVIEYRLTFVEGWTVAMMLSSLQREEKLRHTLAGVPVENLLDELDVAAPGMSPEGLFFPDTYVYRKGSSDRELLVQAYQRMQAVLQMEWQGRDSRLPYESPYQALVMASLVEKETGVSGERGKIAGVFVRRLQQRMKLQTDPAVIYGLGESFDGNLTRAQLQLPGPYNTYRIRGLPPTPIALPGAEAVRAAMHPETGSALYFVARGDGSHQFSDDLATHQAAVRRFQSGSRRADYRSAPSPSRQPEEG